MPRSTDPDLLVGPETSDDAGVYRIGDDCALVETVDIITPLVDDPFLFGQIAAANSLSDVYAMGGRPLTAMNLAFFPSCSLPVEILSDILAGGASKIQEAGACLVGGHTVDDDELKYGLTVTGTIDPNRIVRNSTARPGEMLVLTKPLGSGIISTAIKADMADEKIVLEASDWMAQLNKRAASMMLGFEPGACTDVTGFGLVGHAVEMARGARATIRLHRASIPLMSGVSALVRDGMVPAGCYRNRDFYSRYLETGDDIIPDEMLPLFDPQTSGGLLISLTPQRIGGFLRLAENSGLFVRVIGEVIPPCEHSVEII
ncbi:MAG: selD [Geobacteraceae bacterium]|nr:selD [Geobacteraceae bacterium]